jgi:hypothetical protein
MKTIILIIFGIIICHQDFAQTSWQIIHPERKTYYRANNELHAIAIDSTKQDGLDLYYYNYRITRPVCTDLYNCSCYYPLAPTWLGDVVVQKQNNLNILFNKFNDSLSIRADANTGTIWRFYKFSNGNYIDAELIQTKDTIFLGISDSIKIINLTAKDAQGQIISTFPQQSQIIISKNFGLLQAPDFYEYPDTLNNVTYTLVGMTNPIIGIQNVTAHSIFNYSPGDEFHVESIQTPMGPGVYYLYDYIITKIIDKTESVTEDTVIYTYSLCEKYLRYRPFDIPHDSTLILKNDTQQSTIVFSSYDNSVLNSLPFQSIYTIQGQMILYDFMPVEFSNPKLIRSKQTDHFYYNQDSSCYIYQNAWTPGPDYIYYMDGCGGPYYIGSEEAPPGYNDHKILVYYKKGTEIWGTPLIAMIY